MIIKLLLGLTLLSAGAGGFLAVRQSASELQRDAQGLREALLTQTQLVAAARSEQAGLTERVRELKQTSAQSKPVAENVLWSALQTNRADRLPAELRERLFEELGLNWRSSPDYILVSKQTVRDLQLPVVVREDGKLTEVACTVLALTPTERSQVEAAIEEVKAVYQKWALAHVKRSEPEGDVVANYTLLDDHTILPSITNNFAAALSQALGPEREELIRQSARGWMQTGVGLGREGRTYYGKLLIRRVLAGDEQRLKVEVQDPGPGGSGYLPKVDFPIAFRPIFPNGWADVAAREGFELPSEPPKK